MNSAAPHDFSRLRGPAQDLRPHYEAVASNVLRLLWRRRLLLVAIVGGTLAAALGIASVMEKSYVGEALVQLTFEGDGAKASGMASGGGASIDAAALVGGEADIIRSRAIARRVADILAAKGVQPPAPAPATAQAPPVPATAVAPQAGLAAHLLSVLSDAVARARGSLSSTSLSSFDRTVLGLQQALSVKNDGKTYLIRVGFTADDPVRAAETANAFAEAYLQSRMEASVDAARRTGDWLAGQVADAEASVAATEKAVADFRARTGASVAEAGDLRADSRQLGDLVGQLSNARLNRLTLEGRLARLREAAAADRTPSVTDLSGSTDAARLIEAEVTARQEATRLASLLGTKHPLYARANQTRDTAKEQLRSAITQAISITQSEVESAGAAERQIQIQLDGAKKTALTSDTVSNQLRQLQTQAQSARANLERLTESHRQALALAELKPIAAQLVSAAEPLAVPVSPKMSLVTVLALLGGVAAALGTVFLLELRDIGFRSGDQVAQDLGVQCLGMIPRPTKGDGALGRVREQALKSLVIKAGLIKHRGGNVIVAVTSAVGQEGKSDLVRGLALTLASLDRRVLTIENGGRRPRDEALTVSDETQVGYTWQAGLQTIGQAEGGPRFAGYFRSTNDLQEVLDNHDRLQTWLDEKSVNFDVVIVEAPPVLQDAEALVVARMADLVMFAVKWNSTPKAAVASALQQLAFSSNHPIGVVLSGVDLVRHKALGLRDSLYFYRRYIASA